MILFVELKAFDRIMDIFWSNWRMLKPKKSEIWYADVMLIIAENGKNGKTCT